MVSSGLAFGYQRLKDQNLSLAADQRDFLDLVFVVAAHVVDASALVVVAVEVEVNLRIEM